ncbi:hypothetical protein GALMADRAFT_140225 [Galerina marginata CBS 339.88]|uniref:FCH domain-containing protein n=1 Tax=Galerina marginata (strain CBS 339.88) TaxID=685588 RepID=A0A067SXD0_GALM3|nr:hypothetical protein GALMADRAFT_140225 [Galerina marginata CBS 339.88]
MTALKGGSHSSRPSTQNIPGIQHKCLRRKSRRTYELVNPKQPGESTSFDIGQIRDIVRMDKRLRAADAVAVALAVVASVPAGYAEFASLFNEYAAGPERFATFVWIEGQPVIFTDGSPVVWDHFLIDDGLVPSYFDLPSPSPEPVPVPVSRPSISVSAPTGQPSASSESIFAERSENKTLQALSAHMKKALTTTDELTQFWIERGAIEHQYASRLAKLAERPIGQNEPSEFRSAIDGVRVETAKQAMTHNTLATQIAVELESRCLELQLRQKAHLSDVYEPAARKLQEENRTAQDGTSPHAGVSSEWKKEYRNIRHSLDLRRLDAMREGRNRESFPAHLGFNHAVDFLPGRLTDPPKASVSRGKEWEDLRDSCEQMEQDRSRFMKDVLSAYADVLSSIRTANHESYNTIIHTIDLFRPEDVVEEFSQHFGGAKPDPQPHNLAATATNSHSHSHTFRHTRPRPPPAGKPNRMQTPPPPPPSRPAQPSTTPSLSTLRPLPGPPTEDTALGDNWWDDQVRAMGDYVFARSTNASGDAGASTSTSTNTSTSTSTSALGLLRRPSTHPLPLSGPRPNPGMAPPAVPDTSVPASSSTLSHSSRRRPHSALIPGWVSPALTPTPGVPLGRREQNQSQSQTQTQSRRDARPSLPKLSTNFIQRKNPV